ncbi:MAG: CDP-diacylglycerol--glycerol-3-phosphate 3-phosphatidyltransferase [Planctomycetota bacterium]|nr:CDP-diacylglycerol--glycerol-3-phosphate 3-phosphatidyltransferase [Planctomycetota bacterium]MDA1178441.1 CDP-diacylglycerol--glycerol-3-phosphate 3-phosphatidyltransferase [Planctomycetota bacterium]
MWNLPNIITMARLVGAVIVFVLIGCKAYQVALIVFLIAAATDWLDGYLARRNNQVTQFGRILDPFVDKMLVCGTFTFLVAEPASGVQAWMAVVVFGRELLVTALRSFLEQQSADFSASWSGKVKMVVQLAALTFAMWLTTQYDRLDAVPPQLATLGWWLMVAAMFSTLQSGLEYVLKAASLIPQAAGSPPQ